MSSLRPLDQSRKLKDVLYEIRGEALVEADRLEAEGHTILKLNTGNPAVFGFDAPFQIVRDMIDAIPRGELVLPDDVIRCSLGEPYGFSSLDDEDPSSDDYDLWGA